MAEVSEVLAGYLQRRAEDRARAVETLLHGFTDRERALIREAAVMGYVTGAMCGPHRTRIPPDSAILQEVVDACLTHSDLYPTITGDPT